MSTTVQGLIDRVFREYLEPMDYLNSYTVVATGEGFSDSATTITFDGDLLTQEEEDAMATSREEMEERVGSLTKQLDILELNAYEMDRVPQFQQVLIESGGELSIEEAILHQNIIDVTIDRKEEAQALKEIQQAQKVLEEKMENNSKEYEEWVEKRIEAEIATGEILAEKLGVKGDFKALDDVGYKQKIKEK